MNERYSHCHPSRCVQEILSIIASFFFLFEHIIQPSPPKAALNILILCFHRCTKYSPASSNRLAKMSLTACGWTLHMFPVKYHYYWWDRDFWTSGWRHGILGILSAGLRSEHTVSSPCFPSDCNCPRQLAFSYLSGCVLCKCCSRSRYLSAVITSHRNELQYMVH